MKPGVAGDIEDRKQAPCQLAATISEAAGAGNLVSPRPVLGRRRMGFSSSGRQRTERFRRSPRNDRHSGYNRALTADGHVVDRSPMEPLTGENGPVGSRIRQNGSLGDRTPEAIPIPPARSTETTR